MSLRGIVILTALVVVIIYETQPDFQRWLNYQAVKAEEWLRYGAEWMAWKQRELQREERRRRGT